MGHEDQIRAERELGKTLEKLIKKMYKEIKTVTSTFENNIEKVYKSIGDAQSSFQTSIDSLHSQLDVQTSHLSTFLPSELETLKSFDILKGQQLEALQLRISKIEAEKTELKDTIALLR